MFSNNILLGTFLLVVFLVSCSFPKDVNLLYGEYEIKDDVTHSMKVYSDGTYAHEFTNNGIKRMYVGKWEIIEESAEFVRLGIYDFDFTQTYSYRLFPSKYKLEEGIHDWYPILEKNWGKIQLCFDSDIDQGCFTKNKR